MSERTEKRSGSLTRDSLTVSIALSSGFFTILNAYFDDAHHDLCTFALDSMAGSLGATSHHYQALICCDRIPPEVERQLASGVGASYPGSRFRVHLQGATAGGPADFMGTVWCVCDRCGARHKAVQRYGEKPPDTRGAQDTPLLCACGRDLFRVAHCQLAEGGFSEDGIVVAECAACGRGEVLLTYD